MDAFLFGERIYLLWKNLSEWMEAACDEECELAEMGQLSSYAPEYHGREVTWKIKFDL